MCGCKRDAKCKALVNEACSSRHLALAGHVACKSHHMQARKTHSNLTIHVALAKVI